jgi:hypothetical protein
MSGSPSGLTTRSASSSQNRACPAPLNPPTFRGLPPVRKKFSIACLLFAWLCANGALLDAVQVFAWGKMFAENARTQSLADALRATFDSAKPCELCLGVAAAKEAAKQQLPATLERSEEKLLLALHTSALPVFVSSSADWPVTLASAPPSRTEPVPLPPPRV